MYIRVSISFCRSGAMRTEWIFSHSLFFFKVCFLLPSEETEGMKRKFKENTTERKTRRVSCVWQLGNLSAFSWSVRGIPDNSRVSNRSWNEAMNDERDAQSTWTCTFRKTVFEDATRNFVALFLFPSLGWQFMSVVVGLWV